MLQTNEKHRGPAPEVTMNNTTISECVSEPGHARKVFGNCKTEGCCHKLEASALLAKPGFTWTGAVTQCAITQ